MDTIQAITQRRSIRSFQDKMISRGILEELLEIATKAPSGKNRQPWRFVVLQNQQKDRLTNIMANSVALRKQQQLDIGSCEVSISAIQQAPVVLLVFNAFSKLEADYNHHRLVTDTQSIGAAIQNLMLAAQNFDLGALWICDIFYSEREITSWLNRSDELVAAVAIGYANQSPYARPRKPWQDITQWLE